ncbi:non-ribosomal peptide synthetase [Massilia rubra]|uniref:Amino acid adenylation domain-containing protein n=1 Tax=Massilia rubra TaxID=2607910 RepID=A0ABX0LKN6_9BURK|nr:non-ribosomal peptide synthetase [Massilia rubra]NHZ33325.1 amino acid adenylation domain-containing protein [Massilia rubra]
MTEELDAHARLKRHALLQKMMQRRTSESGHAIPRADRHASLPLSFAQQRLWFLDQLDDAAGAAYHMPAGLRLSGELDTEALVRALDRIVARHENLRTSFPSRDGAPLQHIGAPNQGFALARHDLCHLHGAAQEAAVHALIGADSDAPFALADGPLIRGSLLRLGEREHVLLVTQHHIISDGWSVAVLVRELTALYTAFSQSLDDPLAPLAIQYADYAAWQRDYLQGERLERQGSFWSAHLAGAPALLELPTDHPRPARQSYAGASVAFALPAALTAQLQALGQRHGATLFMVLLGAWSVLMSRLSGQDDVVIGTPVANRQRAEVEPLIGFFVNTLAVRVRLDADPSVAQLIEQVKGTMLDAYAHQDIPFEQVVEALRPARSLSHSPLFQVMLTLNNTPEAKAIALPGLTLEGLGSRDNTSKVDLSMALTEVGGGLQGSLTYATDLFEGASIGRLIDCWRCLLDAMAGDEHARTGRLPLLTSPMRKQLLSDFNATRASFPAEKLIHQLFEEQVVLQAATRAVTYEGSHLSYGELNDRANQLAHYLIGLGVGPDVRVAICLERSLDLVVGLLGILKAGGAYVPLDPTYPRERLADMLADCAPRLVLTLGALAPLLPPLGTAVVCLDAIQPVLCAQALGNPVLPELHARHLAYVIYTSGSTGRPKGAMNEHRSVVNRLLWAREEYAIGPHDKILQKTPFGFDVSVWEFFLPLLAGATLVLARPGQQGDAAYLVELIAEQDITVLHFVPSMLQVFLDQAAPLRTSRLRDILCSGEALPYALQRMSHSVLPQVRLHNLYGPTEAAIDVTYWRCSATAHAGIVPIGRPIWNTSMYVLDRYLQPVPLGVRGELYIGGIGVARGYLNRPELTAERFVADPFSLEPDARMYKTGDVGRWLDDGQLEYLGRNDFQVKLRGFRIELGEIEARLLACEGVREAVVLALAPPQGQGQGDARLVAYLTATPESDPAALEPGALRQALLAYLPEYMVPGAFVTLAALPLTPNGKLDRKALPAPDGAAMSQADYTAPQGAAEQAMAAIWQELLGVERVGRDDHFFELGGHSLLAVTLVQRLRLIKLQVDVRNLFATPVLWMLCASCTGWSETPAHAPGDAQANPALVTLSEDEMAQIGAIVAGGLGNVQDIYPLAPLQEGILFHHMLGGQGDAYLTSVLTSFASRATLDGAIAGLRRTIARHDILRTAILWEGLSEPVQVVCREVELHVEEVVFDAAEGEIMEQLRTRFDPRRNRLAVSSAPLMRLHVCHDAPRARWLMLMWVHHLIADHVAIKLMYQEVGAYLADAGAQLAPSVPYRDYIAQTRRPGAREEQERFFRTMLDGVTEPATPFGLLDVHGDGSDIQEAHLAIDAILGARLRACARRLGVASATLFHLAWAQVLGRSSGQHDVVFGTVLLGRMHAGADAERALGLFINTLPIRIDIGAGSAATLARETHARLAELLRHEHAPLSLAYRCSAVQAPAPLFVALLNYRHGTADAVAPAAVLEGIHALSSEERTNYPLTLGVDDLVDRFALTVQASSACACAPVCALMETALESLVTALESGSDQALATLDILPAAERRRLIVEFNANSAPIPAVALAHAAFERQVKAQPDAIALRYEGLDRFESLSYDALNRRANRLAHCLIAHGVKADDRVALCMARGPDLVVAMLAILKAGAGYVPLDPAYPEQRLAWMLDDSAPSALVTDADGAARWAGRLPACPVIALAGPGSGALADQPDGNPDPSSLGLGPSHLAYVIYTSGTSGQPKGVMVTHRNIAQHIAASIAHYGIGAGDCVLQFTSISFDPSAEQILCALGAGVRLLLRGEHVWTPEELGTLLRTHAVSVANIAPAYFASLGDTLAQADSLRLLIVGGDKLGQAALESLPPGCTLLNAYGPTETTVTATTFALAAGGPVPAAIPIGKPYGNTRVYVLDAHLQPVPLGVSGEIHIGGAGVARGYLNRPELTAERFVVDPFSPAPDARMYKTGDLGRWRTDGQLEYLGRNDFQVKVRGFRIELGEIEARLVACAGVREAVVLALAPPQGKGDARLVAYLTATPEGDASALEPGALRQALLAHLPEYMVPGAFVTLAALPLTPNGKLDRKALPAPDGAALALARYAAPQGATEQALAAIWQELLGVERVGREDHFFDLGGHSLLAVQLASRVRQRMGAELPLRTLFARPLLRELAGSLAQLACAPLAPIAAASRAAPLPLSFAQQRLWFLDQLDHAAAAAYHMPAGLRLSGELDADALVRALDRIVARHESLRTCFVEVDGMPWQRIGSAGQGMALARHDLSHLRGHEQEQALAAQAQDESAAPFDLARGPLIRARLLRLGEREHVLLVTQHHIVSDGWSVGVLVREFAALYTAFSQALEDPLAPLAIQYADYALWQRDYLQGERLERQRSFWSAHLAGAPALLELPTDHPRPARQSHAGASVAFALPAALTAQLQALGQRHGATLFMVLLGAWSVLMSRLSGQDDVVIGTPVANRQRAEVEPLIGFFVNTLAVRVRLDADPSVAQLLEQVKGTLLDAYAHQDIPFEQVVEAVKPVRSASHSPLFQTVITLDNTPASATLSLPNLQLAPLEMPGLNTKFDLTLSLRLSEGRLHAELAYATSLYLPDRIEGLLACWRNLLDAMVRDDAQPVARLALMSADERRRVLVGLNAARATSSCEQLIHRVFEELAERQADAVAVQCAGQVMHYGELNRQANQLAHHLIALGVTAEQTVVICMDRTPQLVVAMLAILKAGGAYVPLDPSYPPQRLHQLFRDSGANIVLMLTGQEPAGACAGLVPVYLDGEAAAIAARPAHNPDLALSPRHLAYVMYTSGSTGAPKGVMIEHRSVIRLALDGGYAPLAPSDCVAHCANPAFDAATWEVWGALLNGARLLVVPAALVLMPAEFAEALLEGGVSAMWLTAGLFNHYIDTLAPVFARLRYLLIGGDVLDPAVVARLLGRSERPAVVLNGYGPTETTTFAATYAIVPGSEPMGQIPLGRPIGHTTIYVLDACLTPVPVGVTGEIYIGGAGVARGYLNQLELSAERFSADPFDAGGDARMYRTGDLGRWRADGNLEYLGRNDMQIKLRGFRIEPGEIEAQLARCAGVRAAVVLAREDQPGDKRLVAYLVTQDDHALDLNAVRDALAKVLPSYLLPSAYVSMVALPLTPNGKVDRKALPAPEGAGVAHAAYAAPEGASEQAMALIWQALLGIEQVGRDDDFFALGGHSLLAVQLGSRVRAAMGVDLPLRQLFATPVLRHLAAALAGAQETRVDVIVPAARDRRLPLSFAQQRLWFLDRLNSAASVAYHIPVALRLRGVLRRDAVQGALDGLVARHESLRTCFVEHDGVPYQSIGEAAQGLTLTERDLSHLRGKELDNAVRLFATDEASAPFDLARGPLIRASLLRLAGDDHVLLVTQHHIISDGWSMGILVREFGRLYSAWCQGQRDPLPALTLQYADYAVWQRDWLQGERLELQKQFWRTRLSGAPALLALPLDRPRPAVQGHEGASMAFTLAPEVAAGVRQLAQRHGATLFMVLLGAWAALMSRLSGQDDVVIGTPVANRQRAEVEPMIGFFANTLAIRVQFDGDPDVDALVAQVKRVTLDAYEHQDIPFEQVVEALAPARSVSHSPLFQVVFSLETGAPAAPDLPGLTLAPLSAQRTTTQFDLALSMSASGDTLEGNLSYSTALFDADSIARMVAAWRRLLTSMLAPATGAAEPVGRLALLDPDQRHQLLEGFNASARPYACGMTLHGLVEAQARNSPDGCAVMFGAQRLSYGELNRRANQLAHYLIGLGVRLEQPVAICMERSPELLVAMLGILKAGAAYLPIDPGYPADRIAAILDDSAPLALLTHAHAHPDAGWSGVRVLRVDGADGAAIASQSDADPSVAGLDARSLAYIIYTSGSSGRPKGALLEHRSVVRLVHQPRYMRIGQSDCLVHCANPGFDAAAWEIWSALVNGASLLIVPADTLLDASRLLQLLQAHPVSILHLTVGLFNQYADLLAPVFSRLAYLLFGGERSDIGTVMRVVRNCPPANLVHCYGPTEASTFSTTYLVAPSAGLSLDAALPIGRPVANTRVYLLDRHGEPVPLGVTGEIHIGGDGVGRGYLNQPGLTAERFVPDPFVGDGAARMYKTGDLGRWLADGNVAYLGRNDAQVKIRGFRIEPGEIESGLAQCDGVLEAVVMARADARGALRLVAYVVGQAGQAPTGPVLRAALAKRFPDYMVPAAFVVLPAFPLTPNGKLDRRALPEPDACSAAPYAAPRGHIEESVAALWRELLGVDRVGRDDHFFELGGHSLMAVQLASRLHALLGVDVPLRHLFAHPTLAQFAAAYAHGAAPAYSLLAPIRTSGTAPPLFLIHPGEGDVDYARTLAARIDSSIPVYGVSASGFQEGETLHRTVEDMAACYVHAIRQLFPQGPYCIAGYSFGGVVAFEMARQLQASGQSIGYLGLIDTPARLDATPCSIDETPAMYLLRSLRAAFAHIPSELDGVLQSLAQSDQLDAMCLAAQEKQLLPGGVDGATLKRHLAVRHTIDKAARTYRVQEADLAATLYCASAVHGAAYAADWQMVLGSVRVVSIGGNHQTILHEPHLARLGAAITADLLETVFQDNRMTAQSP